jgi:hypothetical protein
MSFGSFGAGFGSFGAGVGGLLPSFTNLTDWLRTPTSDGKTLLNSQGTDPELTDVNVLSFDGDNDHIDLQTVPSDLLQGVFNIEFDILIDDSDTSYQRFVWFMYGTAFFRIQKNVNVNTFDFWARNSSGNTLFRNQGLAFTADTLFNFKAIGDGTDVKVYYNDVLQTTISINASNKESGFAPSEPSLGASSTSMKGKLSNFKMSSGGVLHTHLPLAEGSGTKVYDVSGNGHYGTISGATWSTADGIASWNHEYGFDVDSSVKVPALNFKSKQVATTDGSDDEVVFPSAMDFEDNKQYSVTLTFDPTAGTDTTFFASSTASNSRFAISMANGDTSKLVVTVRQSSSTTVETPISSIPSGMITLTASWDGSSTLTASYVDSGGSTTNFTSSSETGVTSGTARTTLGCRSSLSQHSIAKYLLLTVTKDNTVLGSYDFQSDIGTTTVQDTTANNNDGTVTVGSGGTATFWGQRVTDTAGSLVSADYASGNLTISNPGGFVHNGSECGIDVSDSQTASDLFSINNSTATTTFARKDNGNILQVLQYSAPLTGDDLTRTRNYVG